ncbi:MAG: BrnT family toxin [Alphaproteobacteria bacterium]|nr:BrnT family toxin [Alphaproteobacteria bacterium]
MDFEWDRKKNARNIAERGIDFIWAAGIFLGPIIESVDARRDYGEVRWIAIGTADDIELVVVYTWRGTRRRIISARKAHDSERKRYRAVFPDRGKSPPG